MIIYLNRRCFKCKLCHSTSPKGSRWQPSQMSFKMGSVVTWLLLWFWELWTTVQRQTICNNIIREQYIRRYKHLLHEFISAVNPLQNKPLWAGKGLTHVRSRVWYPWQPFDSITWHVVHGDHCENPPLTAAVVKHVFVMPKINHWIFW